MAVDQKDVEMPSLHDADVKQRRKKRSKNNQSTKVDKEDAVGGDSGERGVVYLSHIPHGFYEPQMLHFFAQFGRVTRLKLWRSKKSGKSKGFAYIEFEYEDVAKIVADTMNNYLMFQKLLKCKLLPKDDIIPDAFKKSHKKFVEPYHREVSAKRHNSLLTADTSHIIKNQRRLAKREKKRTEKMKALDIQYNISGYADEWEQIKKARAVITEEQNVEAQLQKAIEMRKQEARKKAKRKANLLSQKRKNYKRMKRKEERKKAAEEEKLQEPTAEELEGKVPVSTKKSPKRKSTDSQESAVPSSGDVDEQPNKKKGKLSTPVPSNEKVSSSESTSKETPTSARKRRKIRRMSLRSAKETAVASPSLEKTPRHSLRSSKRQTDSVKKSAKKPAGSGISEDQLLLF